VKLSKPLIFLLLCVYFVLVVFPLFWLFYSSLKADRYIFLRPFQLPAFPLHWDNFSHAWTGAHFRDFFLNSVIVTCVTVVITTFLAAMTAYAVSRFEFPLSKPILFYFLAGLMIPLQLAIVPLFFQMKQLDMLNSRAGLFLVYLAFGFPFSVFCTANGTYQNTDTTCRADATGLNPALDNPAPRNWFNRDAFTNRLGFTPGVGPWRFGTSGRNVVTGPGVTNFDFSMQKVFRLTEKGNLEFRAEFFNVPNHPMFNLPGATVGTVSYGVISSTHLDSRQIQFGLKLRF